MKKLTLFFWAGLPYRLDSKTAKKSSCQLIILTYFLFKINIYLLLTKEKLFFISKICTTFQFIDSTKVFLVHFLCDLGVRVNFLFVLERFSILEFPNKEFFLSFNTRFAFVCSTETFKTGRKRFVENLMANQTWSKCSLPQGRIDGMLSDKLILEAQFRRVKYLNSNQIWFSLKIFLCFENDFLPYI